MQLRTVFLNPLFSIGAMDAIQAFKLRIEAELATAANQTDESFREAAYMSVLNERHASFMTTATDLLATCIRPRLEVLAGYFENAELALSDKHLQAVCWFGYSQRFPVTVKLVFALAPDERLGEIKISYELSIIPTFMKYDRHNCLTSPLATFDRALVDTWVEERLVAFLRTYMSLEQVQPDRGELLVTDPVCGMRIAASTAAAHRDYKGHPYHFCSTACAAKFQSDPEQYVTVVTL